MMTGVREESRGVEGVADAGRPDHPDALRAVFEAEYRSLVGLATYLVSNVHDAEEVVQEAFVRTLAGWDRVRDRDAADRYVRRAVVNGAKGRLRRRAVARRHPDPPAGSAASAEHDALAGGEEGQVFEAVRALPRRQRECVVLRHHLGCSTAETAAILGIAEGTVKSALATGLATLKQALDAQPEEAP